MKMKPDRGKSVSEKAHPFLVVLLLGKWLCDVTAVLLGNGWVEVLHLKKKQEGGGIWKGSGRIKTWN